MVSCRYNELGRRAPMSEDFLRELCQKKFGDAFDEAVFQKMVFMARDYSMERYGTPCTSRFIHDHEMPDSIFELYGNAQKAG
jgi:hypothetical protein